MKKTAIVLTLISMLAALIAGCSGNSNNASSPGNSPSASSKTSATPDNFNKEGLPIVNTPITLNVLTVRWGNMGDSFKENTWLQELEKTTNVKINWEVKSSNDWGDQKAILMASGELPDVIFGDMVFSSSDIVNNLSLFRPLDDLIEQYMPNLKKAMEESPQMKKISTFPDGKIYSLPARLPSRPASATQPVINKTWLDNLGLPVPTTLDELYNVLKAFKERDPNKNGKPDEIPYSDSKDIDINLISPFGITDMMGTNMVVGNGSLTYYPTSEAYKEAIKWLHRLYSEGLIDKETFTQDGTMLDAKRQNPDAPLIGFSYQWTPDAVFGKWKDQYVTIAPVAGPNGNRYQIGDPNGLSFRRNELLISTTSKYPEVIARWADQFYTSEASIQNFWGAIGTSIQKNSDGTYTLMDPPEGTSADAWYWEKSTRDFGPKYVSPSFEPSIKLDPATGDGLKLEINKLGEPYVTTPYPDVMYTTEENQELPTLTTDIGNFIKSTRAQWITKGNIDAEWDSYVKKLNDMGAEKLIKIYTDAYTRYTSVE